MREIIFHLVDMVKYVYGGKCKLGMHWQYDAQGFILVEIICVLCG
jgi:hypothetical protein